MAEGPEFVMMTAVDADGARAAFPSAVVAGDCARRLSGGGRSASGAVMEPGAVLDALSGFRPASREARTEYSAILKLALVAEAYGLALRCSESDPTTWTPAHDPRYWTNEVQTALSFVAAQLDCTVDEAGHRLFALVETTGASLIDTCREIVAGGLTFLGNRTASTTKTSAPRRP